MEPGFVAGTELHTRLFLFRAGGIYWRRSFFVCRLWSFDFDLRLVGQCVAARGDDFIARVDSGCDLNALFAAYADLNSFDGGVIVGACNQDKFAAISAFVNG